LDGACGLNRCSSEAVGVDADGAEVALAGTGDDQRTLVSNELQRWDRWEASWEVRSRGRIAGNCPPEDVGAPKQTESIELLVAEARAEIGCFQGTRNV